MKIMDSAKYLVHLSYRAKVGSLTPLKLQKLLYLAQGWSYVWDGVPLFEDEFEAWQYGPVNIDIYNHFKQYGKGEIPEEESAPLYELDMSKDEQETLESIWYEYSNWSAFSLVELTHQQAPWRDNYGKGCIISNSDIKQYFQSTF